jgi:SAM-dependent methyltransferase
MITLTAAELASEQKAQPQVIPPIDDPRYFPKLFDDFLTATYCGTDPIGASHRHYMRTDIERGRESVKQLRPWTSIQGKRVLDVGCGYGGMLLAMADAGAASISGVEVDDARLHWAKVRTDSIGFPADLRQADICVEDGLKSFGPFDVILMQDVMEHVPDPSIAIRNISRLLSPGGVVYVQVGNKYSADQLLHDHHCQLPGLTVLSREQAVEYFQTRLGKPADHYAVGYWREEKFYRNVFRHNGVTLHRTEHFTNPETVLWYAQSMSEICTLLEKDLWPDLRPELGRRMRKRMLTVVKLYVHASQQLPALRSNLELVAQACDLIVGRILLPVWRLVGIKDIESIPSTSGSNSVHGAK